MTTQRNSCDTAPAVAIKSIPSASFNRKATEAPSYISRLRSKGRWRINDVERYNTSGFSSALGSIAPGRLPGRDLILDAGCGDSPDCAYALKNWDFKRGIKIDLFDIGQDNQFSTRILTDLERGKVRFIKGDVCEKHNIEGNSVDLIVCNAMIDLIPRPDRALFYEQAVRVLKPGGLFSISYVPLKAGYGWEGWDELKTLRDVGFKHINGGHVSIIVLKKPQSHETVTDLLPSDFKPNVGHEEAQR